MIEVHEIGIGRVWLDQDGIVQLRYAPGAYWNVDEHLEWEALLDRLRGGAPVFILADMGVKGLSPEAKKLSTAPAYESKLAACAMFGSSMVGRMVMNLYLRVQRPSFPLQAFATEAAARDWLVRIRGQAAAS
jgi:hypothetical protein